MGDGIIPSNQEYIRDVAEIDLQEYKDIENIAFYQVATNLGSGLFMESERSLRIHICTDHNGVNFLLEFLHHLVESKESYRDNWSHWSDTACVSFGKQQKRRRVSSMGRLHGLQGGRRTLQDD